MGDRVNRFFIRTAYRMYRSPAGRWLIDRVARSVLIQRITLGGPNPIHLWTEDAEFRRVFGIVRKLSLNRPQSLFNLYQLALAARHLPGHVAEVGVYKGGTARLLAEVFVTAERKIFLFDTFNGMPDTINPELDVWAAGDFADTSLEAVQQALAGFPGVRCLPGRFPDTAGPVSDSRFSMVHIDVDIEQSIQDCCEFFYPRMVPGGVLVFDDYGFRSCTGARQAVDTFFADRAEKPLYFPTGQAVVIKSPGQATEIEPGAVVAVASK